MRIKRKAFTLMEMLIAITLFGIIASIVIVNSNIIVTKTINTKMTTNVYKTLKNSEDNTVLFWNILD